MQEDAGALGLKLLETLHLSVLERQLLPSSGVPFSALVRVVGERLTHTGWFPGPRPPDEMFWTGARLELREMELWVHERYESGVATVGPVRSVRVRSIEEAVTRYIDALGGAPLDGVRIDWQA